MAPNKLFRWILLTTAHGSLSNQCGGEYIHRLIAEQLLAHYSPHYYYSFAVVFVK